MKKLLALTMIALAAFVAPAFAGTDTSDFQVTVTVDPSCEIMVADNIAFASLDVPKALAGADITQNGNIKVLCTAGGSYSIELSNGLYANSGQRRMQHASLTGTYINYELYQDAAGTTVWKTGADKVNFVGDGTRQDNTVYGRLPWTEAILPSAPVGNYADTITATVNF